MAAPAAVSELLTCYQIPLVPTRHVTDEQEAVRAAATLGGPVVLKAEAEGLVHKTEAGAVKLGLHGEQEVHEVAELDLNPVIATQDGVHAVDARIRVVPARPGDPFLRRLR